jgi:hypothetical protein
VTLELGTSIGAEGFVGFGKQPKGSQKKAGGIASRVLAAGSEAFQSHEPEPSWLDEGTSVGYIVLTGDLNVLAGCGLRCYFLSLALSATAVVRGELKAKIAPPAANPSSVSIKKNDSFDIFS